MSCVGIEFLRKTLTQADTLPLPVCLSDSLLALISISQTSALSPPGPGSPEEGPGQPCYVDGPAMLRSPSPACPARLISLSLCQRGQREGCQRAQTTQQMGAEAAG